MKWLWKNKIHLLVLAVCAIYLLSANQIYATFFLKNGKPAERLASLPPEKGEIKFSFDALDTTFYDGEYLYGLLGWAFDPGIKESADFKKLLVLHSVKENVVYTSVITPRNELTGLFSQYKMDLRQAGFRILISKDALKLDNYRVGIILEDDQGNVRTFRWVDAYIERQPNRLRLIDKNNP